MTPLKLETLLFTADHTHTHTHTHTKKKRTSCMYFQIYTRDWQSIALDQKLLPRLLHVFVNTVLLERSHVHLKNIVYGCFMFQCRVEYFKKRHCSQTSEIFTLIFYRHSFLTVGLVLLSRF